MGPDRGSLENTFQGLADDELLLRCASGELTAFAQAIALAEVLTRGLVLPEPQVRAEPEEDYQGDWVMVARYLSYTEAHLLKSNLEAAGVQATVADAQLIQTDALLTPAMRGASVRVPAAHAAEAREIIAALNRGDFQLADDFDPGQQ